MLDWLCAHADIFENFKVKIRAHPNVPMEKVVEQCLSEIPGHFNIAQEPLKDDLAKSFCVAYRQSSIGIQALSNGIPVIHLKVDLPLPGDPIEELTSGKWVANDAQQLKSAIYAITQLSESRKTELINQARGFLKDYFARPTPETMKVFLANN